MLLGKAYGHRNNIQYRRAYAKDRRIGIHAIFCLILAVTAMCKLADVMDNGNSNHVRTFFKEQLFAYSIHLVAVFVLTQLKHTLASLQIT